MSVQIQGFDEPRFSHAETLVITGLTADTLLTWHKRKLFSDHENKPGRGNRRKYSVREVFDLSVMRCLAEVGVPVPSAAALAREIAKMLPLAANPPLVSIFRALANEKFYGFDLRFRFSGSPCEIVLNLESLRDQIASRIESLGKRAA